MTLGALPFAAIVAADFEFEFGGRDGNLPRPVCMVAKELRSGREWRIWRGEFGSQPPFPIGPDTSVRRLLSPAPSWAASARLGWPMPARILDLFAEFRDRTNGASRRARPDRCPEAISASTRWASSTKSKCVELILGGGPWTDEERARHFRLLRRRRRRARAPAAGHVAADRSTARAAARPLHGGGLGHGNERRADRRADADNCCARTGPTFRIS